MSRAASRFVRLLPQQWRAIESGANTHPHLGSQQVAGRSPTPSRTMQTSVMGIHRTTCSALGDSTARGNTQRPLQRGPSHLGRIPFRQGSALAVPWQQFQQQQQSFQTRNAAAMHAGLMKPCAARGASSLSVLSSQEDAPDNDDDEDSEVGDIDSKRPPVSPEVGQLQVTFRKEMLELFRCDACGNRRPMLLPSTDPHGNDH